MRLPSYSLWRGALGLGVCLGLLLPLNGSAAAFAPRLTFVEAEPGAPGSGALNEPISIEMSPNGGSLYVTSILSSTLTVFQRNLFTGMLTPVVTYSDDNGTTGIEGLGGARAVAVSPDSANFYVIGASDHTVTAFVRHQISGASLGVINRNVDGVSGVDGMDHPEAVVVSPDGAHVYIVSSGDDAVTTLRRTGIGGLTFLETIKDGEGGASLDGARALVLSADGRFVYVASRLDDAISIFERDLDTGQLTFVQSAADDQAGVAGLNGAQSVALSPDQRHLYAASFFDNAVVVFERSQANGLLTYVENETAGLNGAYQVAVSPNGRYVLATSSVNDRLVLFLRDPSTGALSLVEFAQDGADGFDGLNEPAGLALSPNGQHVYVAGVSDHALAVLALADLYQMWVPLLER